MFVEQGSREAISIFFQNQADLFFRVAYKYTKNNADAEDVLQSSFLRIIDKANQYKGVHIDEEKLLQSWCLSIVIQSALMNSRTNSNRRKREDLTAANTNPFYEDENMDNNLEKEAVHKKVQNAIIQLPEKYRIPIHLKYIEGFEIETIADILKLNVNTLKSIIKRGLEKVSTQLKDENVTLSSVGLIGLIEGLQTQKAPIAVQSLASNIFESAKSSNRILMKTGSKAALSSSKAILTLTFVSVVLTVGVFSWNYFNAKILPAFLLKDETSVLPNKKIVSEGINRVWDFNNEKDRDIPLVIGKWAWSEEFKCMTTIINRPIMISLPIVEQEKPIVLECELRPNVSKETPDVIHLFNAYWMKNKFLIKHEMFVFQDRYNYDGLEVRLQKIYFYNNYVCLFVNGKCYQVNKYNEDLKEANVGIITNNFMYQKITSRTLNSPPEELLNAIKSKVNQSSVKQENWLINEKEFKINMH
jgi:RNA polymerase sigma-70 factor (ECF subfamily)